MNASYELSRDLELIEEHFDEVEWDALQSAADKLAPQVSGGAEIEDLTVLTRPERIAIAKFWVLARGGEWRPELARMSGSEILAALKTTPGEPS